MLLLLMNYPIQVLLQEYGGIPAHLIYRENVS
jgi:hypothetical protein